METNKRQFFKLLRKAAIPSGQPLKRTSKKRKTGGYTGKQTRRADREGLKAFAYKLQLRFKLQLD